MMSFIKANPFAFVVGCLEWVAAGWSIFVNGNCPIGLLWFVYGIGCFILTYMEYIK